MISLQSSNSDILKEMREGREKALYWYNKSIGGEKKRTILQAKMLLNAHKTGKDQMADVFEYIDNNGNRWRVYDCVRFDGRNKPYLSSSAFVYYETLGSCGAFVNIFDAVSYKVVGVVVYTAHFFQRMCERLDIKYKSSAMIKQFLDLVPGQTFQLQDGKAIVCLPASQGRGIVRSHGDDGFVIEIRTFLTNPMLNNKQKRETKRLRDLQGFKPVSKDEMEEFVDKYRDNGEYDEKAAERMMTMCELRGMNRKYIEQALNVNAHMLKMFTELGYVDINNKKLLSKLSTESIMYIYDLFHVLEEYNGQVSEFLEFLRIAKYIAKKLNIQNFDTNKFGDKMYVQAMKELPQEPLDYEAMLKEYNKTHAEIHDEIGASFNAKIE